MLPESCPIPIRLIQAICTVWFTLTGTGPWARRLRRMVLAPVRRVQVAAAAEEAVVVEGVAAAVVEVVEVAVVEAAEVTVAPKVATPWIYRQAFRS